MRPPLYFDGEPNTFRQLQRLFPTVSRLQVRYAAADRERIRLLPKRQEDGRPGPRALGRWTPAA